MPLEAFGWLPEQVGERAGLLLQSAKVQGWFAEWSLNPEDWLKSFRVKALARLVQHLDAKTAKGAEDFPTQARAIENILDRTGMPRRQTIRNENVHEHKVTREQALAEMREMLELEQQGNRFLTEAPKGDRAA